MNVRARRQDLERFVWDADPGEQGPARAALIRGLRVVTVVARDIVQGPIRLHATSLVYTSLLALIPFLAVIFSVLKAFGMHQLLEPMLLNFLAPLQEKGVEFTRQLLQFVSRMRVGVLGAVGFGLLIYTSATLVRKVEQAFNSIWHVRHGRRLIRRLGDYAAVIVLGPLLFFAALGVTASAASSGWLKPLHGFVTVAAKVLPYLLVIGGYLLLYVFIPNTKVRLRSAFVGAIVAGVLWQSTGWAFATFVTHSGQYRAVYASFAILILFILWTYTSWLILLIGAAIAHYHQHPERITREPRETSLLLSNRKRERLGLMLARMIAEHYYSGRPPWTAEALARRLQHPVPAIEHLLAAFIAQGLLTRTRDTPPSYLPLCALDTVPLSDVLRAIRSTGIERGTAPADPAVDAIVERLTAAANQAVAGLTWRDLIAAEIGATTAATPQARQGSSGNR
ncbi:MAG: YihY/virulence factor BrkB family protein [Sulfurifustaceae bacterium]